jgi:hypothetical protein
MTRRTNARIAGFTYLFYIATAFPAMVLFGRAAAGDGMAAKLAAIGRHASDVRLVVLLLVLDCAVALVLAMALYGITRDEDHDLAVLALACRVGEGVLAAIPALATLGLLWLGTAAGPTAPDAAAAHVLGGFLLRVRIWGTTISASFFAVGSTLFSYLLLRGRLVPAPLAWLGVVASVPLVFVLPAQLVGFLAGPADFFLWLPMLVFEVVLGFSLLFKGVAGPTHHPTFEKRPI